VLIFSLSTVVGGNARDRGFAVNPEWGDEIQRVKAFRFD